MGKIIEKIKKLLSADIVFKPKRCAGKEEVEEQQVEPQPQADKTKEKSEEQTTIT